MSQPAMNPDEVKQLLIRGATGDPAVIDAVREVFAANPGLGDRIGDLAAASLNSAIDLIAGDQTTVREGILHKLNSLRRELLPIGFTAIERLLIELIVIDWSVVHHYAIKRNDSRAVRETRLQAAAERYYQRAHGRFRRAIQSLALVQKALGRKPVPYSEVVSRLDPFSTRCSSSAADTPKA